MSIKKAVCIINSGPAYVRMFRRAGWKTVKHVKDADLVQFTGGEDVTPRLYGEIPHNTSHYNSIRDEREAMVFHQCIAMNKPMAGICRGGQFLNVMCGGKMWQHVDCHAVNGTHTATDVRTGEEFQVTSTHHQMMRPSESNKPEVIVTAAISTFRERMSAEAKPMTIWTNGAPDIEALYYPIENVFCFQPHPEFLGQNELAKRFFGYVEELLFHSE